MTTLASMTGFSRVTASTGQGQLAWELKTVNAKGLDVRLRLPNGFDGHEAAYRARIGAALGRGTCQATLTVQRPAQPASVRLDGALLRSLVEAIAAAVPPGSPVGPATVDGLLGVRGVLDITEAVEEPGSRDKLDHAALSLLDEALRDLTAARAAEGKELGLLLVGHVERIQMLVEAADHAPGRSPAAVAERLQRAVAALVGQQPALDPARLHQEAILLATRADIREELDRLRIHCGLVSALLASGGVVGRKLDFLAQELAREASTLCAKSNDAALTAIGLDLRQQIEQFREQVQNLE